MKKYIEQIVLFILENIVTLITIICSFCIVIGSQWIQTTTTHLLMFILSLIGLMATSMLIERCVKLRKIEKHSEATYRYLTKMDGKSSFDVITSDRKNQIPLEERFENAREINIAGGSLIRLTNEYLGLIEKKAKDGCVFKFLLVNPDGQAVKILFENVVQEFSDCESYSEQIKNSLSRLHTLKMKYPKKIEVRTYENTPAYSLLITDPQENESMIDIELYSYGVPVRERIRIIIKHLREPRSYKFFIRQFELMWKQSDQYLLR